jgi:hypothetical protein
VYHPAALGLAVVLAGVAATRLRPPARAPQPETAQTDLHVVFADTEGWYRTTPHESALLSPYDLSLDSLPESLPLQIGEWIGSERFHDPAVDQWLEYPEVNIQRTYTNPAGDVIWLSVFGSQGHKSFSLFYHTPSICYPLSGWQIDSTNVIRLPVGGGQASVQHAVARRGQEQLVVLYWYLWDNPARDPADGMLSLRLTSPVSSSPEETLAMMRDDFLAGLFVGVLPWKRF